MSIISSVKWKNFFFILNCFFSRKLYISVIQGVTLVFALSFELLVFSALNVHMGSNCWFFQDNIQGSIQLFYKGCVCVLNLGERGVQSTGIYIQYLLSKTKGVFHPPEPSPLICHWYCPYSKQQLDNQWDNI